ncbi:baseplate protein [Petralouisia muris]|jgi:phage baseplate assembly protein W|uniref:Baseplate protein n=1 Tax=Petralouisia muris TaxID=3032872 RepID=A0AC61RX88_9FIRM|nr:GPW/gp25 family protein [Petralouisia muris]TGY96634.1 baseplate protein [Petralouisia muris]
MDQRNGVKAFLGTGWKFPVEIDGATGRIKMSSNEDSIRESVRIIIGTRPGELPMHPEFGCRIRDYTFESADYTTLYSMKTEVEHALIRWEPRITDIQAEVSDEQIDQGLLMIYVSYVIRSTNSQYNLVYPFYINEGE